MINYLILMAGAGSRFFEAGFIKPKPFIQISQNLSMIELACRTLRSDEHARYIFVCRNDHKQHGLVDILTSIAGDNDIELVMVDQLTEGAACSALLAKDFIDTNDELIIMNSDQVLDWSFEHFLKYMRQEKAQGGIPTFIPQDGEPKWSYAKLDTDKVSITEVQEKNAISQSATAGVYYFSSGKLFVQSAEEMIAKNDRVNNEFYVAPVYNYAIKSGNKILNYPIVGMYGTGTPEDLELYKQSNHYKLL